MEAKMAVEKVGFVGFRCHDLPALREILEDGLGLVPTDTSADQVGYLLSDGSRLEAYDETNAFHSFFTTGPVVGFSVPDFERSWGRLRRLGIEPLTDPQSEKGRRWVHFRLPDGTVAELIGGVPT
jgi:catechol 2,3-dioxygenase-like lactoylglutathione lyase family enzyme